MYSEKTFIHKYKKPKQGFNEFVESAVVAVGEKREPVKSYIKRKNIHLNELENIYESISKVDYLTSYYKKSLNPYVLKMKHTPMPNKAFNNNANVQYKNIIRNMHYDELMEKTTPGVKNTKSFGVMLNDLYKKNIIDYKLLTPSALHYIKQGRIGSVYSSYYFRSSIMNPYLVYSINQSLLKGRRIFTPTLGWSSYCYGFLECDNVTTYVGTDVIPSVCKKTQDFANKNYPSKKTEIYCSPSEDLLKNKLFIKTYTGYFDTIFFSPPYFALEQYSGAKQSINRYKTYEQWLENYWDKTVELCAKVLAKGGKMCYIIGDYGSPKYNLIQDTLKKCLKHHFKLLDMQPMYNKGVYVTKTSNLEQIIYLKKL